MKSPNSTKKRRPLPELQPHQRAKLEGIAAGIRARKDELERRQQEEELNTRAQSEHLLCSKNPCHFIANYCQIQNDAGDVVPFDLYLYQRDYIQDIIHFEDDGTFWIDNDHHDKSRQLGFSWLYMAIELWAFTYYEGFRAKNLSRKEAEVDDGGEAATTDSMHGKFKFMHDRLPETQRTPVRFSKLQIRRLDGKPGFITGESANPNAGRGGTYDFILMDEAAFIPWSERILAAVTQACKQGVVLNSTPYGKDGAFGRIKFDKKSGFTKHSTHWSEHPVYAEGLYHDKEGRSRSPWYDEQCSKMTPEDIARELDLDYEGSVAAKVFPEAAQGMTIAKVRYDPALPLHMWWDFGMADPTSVIIAQIYRGGKLPEVRIVAEYEHTDLVPPEHAENLRAILKQIGFRGDTRTIRCFGDPAANARSLQKKTTLIADYRDEGFIIRFKQSAIRDGIKLCKLLLLGKIGTLWVDEDLELFPKHVHGNRYPTDQLGQRKKGAEEPDNDSHNHMMAAWRYGLVNNFKSTQTTGGAPRTSKR